MDLERLALHVLFIATLGMALVGADAAVGLGLLYVGASIQHVGYLRRK